MISSKILRFLFCYFFTSFLYMLIENVPIFLHVPIPAPFVIIFDLVLRPIQLVYELFFNFNVQFFLRFFLFLFFFTTLWIFLSKQQKQRFY